MTRGSDWLEEPDDGTRLGGGDTGQPLAAVCGRAVPIQTFNLSCRTRYSIGIESGIGSLTHGDVPLPGSLHTSQLAIVSRTMYHFVLFPYCVCLQYFPMGLHQTLPLKSLTKKPISSSSTSLCLCLIPI